MRVGVAGFGAIGQRVAILIEQTVPEVTLTAITSRDLGQARANAVEILRHAPPVVALSEVVTRSDLVIEAAPAPAFREIAVAVLGAGKPLLTVSLGALLDGYDEYVALARRHGAVIHAASGAIGGLDALAAAAIGQVGSVVMTTRKPPRGLAGAPYLDEHRIDVTRLTEPTVVFEGTAREAIRGFPANVNVAVAVSLAGIGPDRTRVRIVADPTIIRNTHDVDVVGDFGRLTVRIENTPSANPRTGVITAQSVIATLKKLTSPVRIGT